MVISPVLELDEFVELLRSALREKTGFDIAEISINSHGRTRIHISTDNIVECEKFRHEG